MLRLLTVLGLIAMQAPLLARAETSNNEQVRDSLFAEAREAMTAAKKARADLMAPKNFEKALGYFQKAEKKFDKGKRIDDIRGDLNDTLKHLKQAVRATKLAEVAFAATIQARTDAGKVSAAKYSGKEWNDAEKKFRKAATELENGDGNDAKEEGEKARAKYREAELKAIKGYLFADARRLHKLAEEKEVQKYAPKTLARSLSLLQQAEDSLNKDRYDTDRPRILALEARYEANHAIHVASVVAGMDERDITAEDLIVGAEAPLRKIASALEVTAKFDTGYQETTDMIVKEIGAEKSKAERLRQEVSDRRQNILDLERHIATLEARLGGAQAEQSTLEARMRAQEEVRKRFEHVETMFEEGEARVLREGDVVIVRLIGMNFDVGQSTIRPEYFGLFAKLQEAIRIFPNPSVRVEGHTDAYGSDKSNLKLSQERAEAVRLYLEANMGETAPQLSSVGYGEARPIANNETKEGRATNRRIDVVIAPTTTTNT